MTWTLSDKLFIFPMSATKHFSHPGMGALWVMDQRGANCDDSSTMNFFIFTNCTIIGVCILILVLPLALRRLQALFVLHRLLYRFVGDDVHICHVTKSDILQCTILPFWEPNKEQRGRVQKTASSFTKCRLWRGEQWDGSLPAFKFGVVIQSLRVNWWPTSWFSSPPPTGRRQSSGQFGQWPGKQPRGYRNPSRPRFQTESLRPLGSTETSSPSPCWGHTGQCHMLITRLNPWYGGQSGEIYNIGPVLNKLNFLILNYDVKF